MANDSDIIKIPVSKVASLLVSTGTRKQKPSPCRSSKKEIEGIIGEKLDQLESPAVKVLHSRTAKNKIDGKENILTSIPMKDGYHSTDKQTGYAEPGGNSPRLLCPPGASVEWGCLKTGGSLPTLREYLKKIDPPPPPPLPPATYSINDPTASPTLITNNNTHTKPPINTSELLKQHRDECMKGGNATKNKMQKRTIRRRRVSGSSNKGVNIIIPPNITYDNTRKTEPKLSTIQEKRRVLIKKGLLEPSSTAPNDIIQELYNSISDGDTIYVTGRK